MTTLFSELNSDWIPIPEWANFLIRLGYAWPRSSSQAQRRIAVLSMPCDSAGAYLTALGSLIRDLCSATATNVTSHYDSLLRHARQYLGSCRECDNRCDPESKRCGYAGQAIGVLRNKDEKLYPISTATDFASNRLVVCIENGTWQVWPKRALDLQIKGEPRPRLAGSVGALVQDPYLALVPGAKIVNANLRESYSGLCVAGRSAGETASREVCTSIRFRKDGVEYTLPQLLTIQGWSDATAISRISFFNCRTDQFDSHAQTPSLVVADGDASFLKVLTRSEFQSSDIIGVVHRTIDRERLEAVGLKIAGLRQWYVEDAETSSMLPPVPRGISAIVFSRRWS
jgi:hypothetical protein